MTPAKKSFSFEIGKCCRKLACAAVLLLSGVSFAADRVVGTNGSLDIQPGARSAGFGSATMAADGDYLGLVSNPYQLANVGYAWASFSHTEYYEGTKFDFASAVLPIGDLQGIGVAFSRFGADDIPYIKDGEPLPNGAYYKTLSIADWMFSVSFGKKLFNRLDLGASFHGLYRDLDQSGFGFRSDVGLRYQVIDQLYVAGLLKGWTSSAAVWKSGEFEYASPELYLAASYGLDIPYLYGRLNMYWQSAGLFHRESRELGFADDDRGGRIWESPLDWLSGGHGGLEFCFDFGLSLRAGLSSFTTFKSVTAGAGITIAKFLKVDYAFEAHPVLSNIHRVSVSVSPYLFAKKPRPGTPEAEVKVRNAAVLTEEPEDELMEPLAEEGVSEEKGNAQVQNSLEKNEKDNASTEPALGTILEESDEEVLTPSSGIIQETDDEILE